jgi:hypothetical protein
MIPPSYSGYRFPRAIIWRGVWMCRRFKRALSRERVAVVAPNDRTRSLSCASLDELAG